MPTWYIEQWPKGRRITFDGRALPFASSVEWGGEQRADLTWLPGSPDAVAQIFGPKELPMHPEGRWGDRYMQAGAASECLIQADGQQLTSALDAAQYMDLLRQEGRLLRVAYDREVRYGILVEFRYRPFAEGRTLERIDWSARFEWTSRDSAARAPAVPARTGIQSFASRLAILAQQVEAAHDAIKSTSVALQVSLSSAVAKIMSISASANAAARGLTQRATDAASIAQATTGLTAEATAAAYEMTAAARSVTVSTAASLQESGFILASAGRLAAQPALGSQIVLSRDIETFLRLGREMQDLADLTGAQAQEAVSDAEPFVVYAMRGEDLRDIARRYLDSAAAWRDIAQLNGSTGTEVAPGVAILVPKRKSVRPI